MCEPKATTTAGAVALDAAIAVVSTKTGLGTIAMAGLLAGAYCLATASLALAVAAMVVSTAAAIGGIILLARAQQPVRVAPQVAPVRQPVRVLEARPARVLTASPDSITELLVARASAAEPRK